MSQPSIPFRALVPFLVIAFGLAWGLFAVFVSFPDRVLALFGPLSASNPLFILAVYAPAFAALIVLLAYAGPRAIGPFLARLTLWRLPLPWLAFLVLAIPAISFAGAAIKGAPFAVELPEGGAAGLVGALLFMLLLGPIEEFGWRGVALPLLQRRMAPLWAGLVLGAIWALWHVPAFFASGTPQSGFALVPFLLGATAVGVIMVPFFNAARGSLLWAALFHFQLNNPLFPDAQPWDMLLYVLVAVVVVVVNRKSMLRCTDCVTRVC